MPNGFFGKNCKKGIKQKYIHMTIEFYIFEIFQVSNFSLTVSFDVLHQINPKKGIFDLKKKTNIKIIIEFYDF